MLSAAAGAEVATCGPLLEDVERQPEKKEALGLDASLLSAAESSDVTISVGRSSELGPACASFSKFWDRCLVKRELRNEPKLLAIDAALPPTSAAPARTTRRSQRSEFSPG